MGGYQWEGKDKARGRRGVRVGGGLPVTTSRAAAREGVTWEVAQQWKCKRPRLCGRILSGRGRIRQAGGEALCG